EHDEIGPVAVEQRQRLVAADRGAYPVMTDLLDADLHHLADLGPVIDHQNVAMLVMVRCQPHGAISSTEAGARRSPSSKPEAGQSLCRRPPHGLDVGDA